MELLKALGNYAKHQRILLIEEDKELNKEIQSKLSQFFEKVDAVFCGFEALELYKHDKYDIVLTDINTPQFDGLELIIALKAKNPKQAIVVISACEKSEYLIDLINIGTDGFILKPYTQEQFLHIMLKVTENEASKKELEKEKIKRLVRLITLGSRYKSNNVNNAEYIKEYIKPLENLDRIPVTNDTLENLQCTDDLYLQLKQAIEDFVIINEDFEDVMNDLFQGDLTKEKLDKLSDILRSYYLEFLNFEFFEGVAHSIDKLSKTIKTIDLENITPDKREAIEMIEYIQRDIKEFVDIIFISKSSVNLNYFTDSLQMCVNDIEVRLGMKKQTFGDMFFF